MVYRKTIMSLNTVNTLFDTGDILTGVILVVGRKYKVTYSKPTNKKDRKNNGRVVEVLGFTDNFMGDVIVRYLDNNRRGRVEVNCLQPYSD